MATDRDERRGVTTDGHDLVGAAFDALPAQVAVVDREGVIRETNRAWRQFGAANDVQGDPDMVGENYLTICDASSDETATEAAAGIRAVLAGDRSEFALEYPCHSPDERRWFLMRAIALEEPEERHALVMHVDITDRKEVELRVAASNETLATVAGVLSHDLRNPLNVAMARAELLANDPDAGPETVAEQTAAVRSALDRIDAIIDDALVLSRESERIDAERVSLATVARDAWGHVETGDAALAVTDDATLVADASLLAQLLENLYRNAVEHGDCSRVTVGTTPGGFFVADDGPGIAPADRDRVFDAGYSTDKSAGNTGMGLAIVEKIAGAHGWSLRLGDAGVDDSEDQTGARFSFGGVTADR